MQAGWHILCAMLNFSKHRTGARIRPFLYIVMESNLHPIFYINLLFKYVDDSSLLVPESIDFDVKGEYYHFKKH